MRTEIVFPNNLHSKCPSFQILFSYKKKIFQPTSTTIFDESLPSNVEVST